MMDVPMYAMLVRDLLGIQCVPNSALVHGILGIHALEKLCP